MIDSELTKALLQLDDNLSIGKDAPILKMVSAPHLDWETEVDIGKDRTVDILITVNYRHQSHRAIAIEIENDRKFDIEAVLRRIKRQKTYSTVVVIPKEFERHSFQFQKSGIPVWYWTATCRWTCRSCGKTTTTSSSLTPNKCQECNKQGFLSWIEPEDIKFTEATKNPQLLLKEIPRGHVSFV